VIVQLVRTIEGNAGSNPAANLGLVLTAACRLTDSKSVFQSTSLLKRCTTKKTVWSLSVQLRIAKSKAHTYEKPAGIEKYGIKLLFFSV